MQLPYVSCAFLCKEEWLRGTPKGKHCTGATCHSHPGNVLAGKRQAWRVVHHRLAQLCLHPHAPVNVQKAPAGKAFMLLTPSLLHLS